MSLLTSICLTVRYFSVAYFCASGLAKLHEILLTVRKLHVRFSDTSFTNVPFGYIFNTAPPHACEARSMDDLVGPLTLNLIL